MAARIVEQNHSLSPTLKIISCHSRQTLKLWSPIASLTTFLFFFFISYYSSAQTPFYKEKLKFELLSTKDGLPSNWVDAILQDRQGFIWFGTFHGLARYDGYEFRNFSGNPLDTNSIGNRRVFDLVEDSNESLWAVAENGLFNLNRNSGKLKRIRIAPNRSQVTRLLNADSLLWINTGVELFTFNKHTKGVKRYPHDPYEKKSFIYTIFEDNAGSIWISTSDGLKRLDTATETFRRFSLGKPQYYNQVIDAHVDEQGIIWLLSLFDLSSLDPLTRTVKKYQSNLSAAAGGFQWTLCEDSNGYLWIGSWQKDIIVFNPKTERFARVQPSPNDPHSLPENIIRKIYRDRSGNLWFGTSHNGVAKLAVHAAPFKQYDLGDTYNVSAIAEDSSGSLFVGTWGDYVLREKKSGGFRKLPIPVGKPLSGTILKLYADRKGTVWGGSLESALIRFDAVTDGFKFVPVSRGIAAIFEDSAHRLWVGTEGAPSLGIYDRQEGTFRFLNTDSTFGKIRTDVIKTFLEDSRGSLWIGGSKGLFRIDNIDKWGGEPNPNLNIVHYRHNPDDSTSLSSNSVLCLYEDQGGNLWVGTGVGLNKFSRDKEEFTRFFIADGLPSDQIDKILEDNKGNLWLSTPVALCWVDLSGESPHFRNYDFNGSVNTIYKRRSGEILVGTTKGFLGFFPDSLRDNPNIPPVAITGFKINNKSLQLDTTISRKKHIILPHDQNFFSLEFAALEFTAPEKNQYAYMMEGLETNWNYIRTRRFGNYTNVAPGSYLFRVKASNNDGVWNEEGTSLRITILPPWWETWWAYSIYVALILGTLYGLRRYELSRQRFKHHLELKNVEAEKFLELDKMKSHFFANISHEFRTPLTLIKGPIERWLPEIERPEMRQDFEMTQRNTNRLLKLVNQLLDISRLESGKMKLQARSENIVELTRQLTMAFESLASVNDIELRFTSPEEPITVYVDREHYEKIITNLLSNALKFTPKGGKVIVDCGFGIADLSKSPAKEQPKIQNPKSEIGEFVRIGVKDTGAGIPAGHLPHIFDRFYQAGDSYAKDLQGSGIGLALTKELVELHHGKIEVVSEVGQGTEFTIWLPLGKEHLQENEIADFGIRISDQKEENASLELSEPMVESNALKKPSIEKSAIPNPKSEIVLIVEDNPDMRSYIRELLVESYKVVEATDGQKGFEKAAEIIPDIIVSDVMMPVMDGFQFCEKIKTDERTSHIPVILLTAKSSGESKVEGLETGADDYLIKPFDSAELKVRLKNLIEQRRKLRERFRQEITLEPNEIAITSADAQFLQKVMDAVEQNIESEYGVAELSNEVGMSRSQLHRKIRALTDQSPVEFIRCIKLKRAAALLEQHSGNISEIAYQVGFNNPAYFAECFHKLFGVSPKEYSTQSKN